MDRIIAGILTTIVQFGGQQESFIFEAQKDFLAALMADVSDACDQYKENEEAIKALILDMVQALSNEAEMIMFISRYPRCHVAQAYNRLSTILPIQVVEGMHVSWATLGKKVREELEIIC